MLIVLQGLAVGFGASACCRIINEADGFVQAQAIGALACFVVVGAIMLAGLFRRRI